jgi:hypothetical protein
MAAFNHSAVLYEITLQVYFRTGLQQTADAETRHSRNCFAIRYTRCTTQKFVNKVVSQNMTRGTYDINM